jgi:hypothetical protein
MAAVFFLYLGLTDFPVSRRADSDLAPLLNLPGRVDSPVAAYYSGDSGYRFGIRWLDHFAIHLAYPICPLLFG